MHGVLFGVPHYASTHWQPYPHPDLYKIAQPEVAAWSCRQGLLCWLQKGYWHHPLRAVPSRHAGTTELCSELGFSPLSCKNLDFCPYLAVPRKSKHRCV